MPIVRPRRPSPALQAELEFAAQARGRSWRVRAPMSLKIPDGLDAVVLMVRGKHTSQNHRVLAFKTQSEMTSFLAQYPQARVL